MDKLGTTHVVSNPEYWVDILPEILQDAFFYFHYKGRSVNNG
jgi:hypothetical protein